MISLALLFSKSQKMLGTVGGLGPIVIQDSGRLLTVLKAQIQMTSGF